MAKGSNNAHINSFAGGIDRDTAPTYVKNNVYYDSEDFVLSTNSDNEKGFIVNLRGTRKAVDFRPINNYYRLEVNSFEGLSGSPILLTISMNDGTVYQLDISNMSRDEMIRSIDNFLKSSGFTVYNYNDIFVFTKDGQGPYSDDNNIQSISNSSYYNHEEISSKKDDETRFNVIASDNFGNDIVLITCTGDLRDCQIWYLEYDGVNDNFNISLKYTNDNIKLKLTNSVDITTSFEVDSIKRIYWTDNYNPPYSLNVADENLFAIPETSLTFVDKVSLPPIKIKKIESNEASKLTEGMYQFGYKLKNSVSGDETNVAPLTHVLRLIGSKDFWDVYNYFGSQGAFAYAGCTITLEADIDSKFYDTIELYAIRTTYDPNGSAPTRMFKIAEETISPEGKFIHLLNYDVATKDEIDFADYTVRKTSFNRVKTLEVKDNRLFVGNIEESVFNIDFDTRTFRYKSDGTCYAPLDNNGDPLSNYLYNPYNYYVDRFKPVGVTVPDREYKYKSDGVTLGGEGKYISYEFITADSIIDYNNDDPSSVNSVPHITNAHYDSFNTINGYTFKHIYKNPKDPLFNFYFTGYRRGEIYRFGIVFYDNFGNQSPVYYIEDIRMPDPDENGFNLFYKDSNGYTHGKILGLRFTVNIPPDISSKISGYSIVRVPRELEDRTIISDYIKLRGIKLDDLTGSGKDLLLFQDPCDIRSLSDFNKHGYSNWLSDYSDGGTADKGYMFSCLPTIAFDKDIGSRKEYISSIFSNTKYNGSVPYIEGLYAIPFELQASFDDPLNPGNSVLYIHGSNGTTTYSVRKNISVPVIVDQIASHQNLSSNYIQLYSIFNKYYDIGDYSSFDSFNIITYDSNNFFVTINQNETSLLKPIQNHLFFFGRSYNKSIYSTSGSDITSYIDGTNTYNYVWNERGVIYYDNRNQYGGLSLSAIENNEYMYTGHYQKVESSGIYTSDVFGGDVYIGQFDTQIVENGSVYAILGDGSHLYRNSGAVFMIECEHNMYLRHRDTANGDYLFQVDGFTGGKYDQEKLEDYISSNVDIDRVNARTQNVITVFKNRVHYSDVKVNGELTDSFTSFRPLNFRDLDNDKNSITKLVSLNDKMYAIQEDGVAVLAINPKPLINISDGTTLQLGQGDVIADYAYMSEFIGSKHLKSVLKTPYYVYFYDVNSNAIYRVGSNGFDPVSDIKSFRGFFDKDIQKGLMISDNTYQGIGIESVYDNYYNNAIFTIFSYRNKKYVDVNGDSVEMFQNNAETIIFSEKFDALIGRTIFVPRKWITNNNKLLSQSNLYNGNNSIYIHNEGDYDNVYDYKGKESSITFIVNPPGNNPKIFNNIEYYSNVIDTITNSDIFNKTFTAIRVYNNYQDTGKIDLIPDNNIRRRIRVWRTQIPRDGNARIRNPYTFITLYYDNNSTDKITIDSVITYIKETLM
jgi:hypothetical protein